MEGLVHYPANNLDGNLGLSFVHFQGMACTIWIVVSYYPIYPDLEIYRGMSLNTCP